MTQPFDRGCSISAQGKLDREAGEFWVENPFEIVDRGKNLSAFERNKMFLNMGGGASFLNVSFTSGADLTSDSRSAIAADFNRDGAPDLLVGSVGGGCLRLFLNQFPSTAHRTVLRLAGTTSNRAGIGARLEAVCGTRRIVRDLFPANGFMGQSPPEIALGVGEADSIDKLTIRWPTGEVQTVEHLPVDRSITIVEGQAGFESAEFPRRDQ